MHSLTIWSTRRKPWRSKWTLTNGLWDTSKFNRASTLGTSGALRRATFLLPDHARFHLTIRAPSLPVTWIRGDSDDPQDHKHKKDNQKQSRPNVLRAENFSGI